MTEPLTTNTFSILYETINMMFLCKTKNSMTTTKIGKMVKNNKIFIFYILGNEFMNVPGVRKEESPPVHYHTS